MKHVNYAAVYSQEKYDMILLLLVHSGEENGVFQRLDDITKQAYRLAKALLASCQAATHGFAKSTSRKIINLGRNATSK